MHRLEVTREVWYSKTEYVAPDGSRYIMIPEGLKKRKAQMAGADKPFFIAAN